MIMHPINLHGSLTGLRDFALDDLDAVHAIIGDERVTNWLSFDQRSRDEAQAMLAGVRDRA